MPVFCSGRRLAGGPAAALVDVPGETARLGFLDNILRFIFEMCFIWVVGEERKKRVMDPHRQTLQVIGGVMFRRWHSEERFHTNGFSYPLQTEGRLLVD